jgi:CheY-like chemotaxis protein
LLRNTQGATAQFIGIGLWIAVYFVENKQVMTVCFSVDFRNLEIKVKNTSALMQLSTSRIAQAKHPRREMPAAVRKTLLLIDDREDELGLRQSVLEHFGYVVLAAGTGQEGLELLASHAVDEVLLDYQMPEMNGEMVATEMRRTKPGVPILMLSGCVSVPKSVRKLVDRFIAKGVSSEFLLREIERLLNRLRRPMRSGRSVTARKSTALA